MNNNIRNIGILAHVDAGKTTITENFLFLSGITKQLGSVDNGTSQTDFLEVERERGISVRSSNTSFTWKDTQINLIDTPGHVDFSSDVERIIRVLDGAILVLSAVEGVQAHTETLWKSLRENNIPTIIFINKIDRVGADVENVIHEIQKELSPNIVVLQTVQNEETNDAKIKSYWDNNNKSEEVIESIANIDEDILESYLEGEDLSFDILNQHLIKAIQNNQLFPVLFGSAKNSKEVEVLLNSFLQFLPPPHGNVENPLSALVYKIEHDKTMGKIAHVKVFEGSITNREVIKNQTQNCEEKVTQVRKILSNKFEDIGKVEAGNIAGISGLTKAKVGDILGNHSEVIPNKTSLRTPLLTVQVKAENVKLDNENLLY